MPLFVLFVFGAVILGAGAMLSPAWPTRQPRVALGAAFALAMIVGGAVFYASLFEWDTLVIDYLLFALVVGIFLGGTLSVGQSRAEKHGTVLSDSEQGWPGPQDLAFFAVIGLFFALPVLIFPVPLGSAGQGYGFLALVVREGENFTTFAPYHPEIEYLYPPGFSALTGYLSQQLNQDIATVQFTVAAILSLLNVWLAYDFGAELRDKRLGRAMAITMLLSLGVLGALLNAHFTALLGLIFTQAFFVYLVRYTQHRYPADAIAAGLLLGAVAISHPGMTIVAGLGFVPWLATMWLGEPRPKIQTWLVMALVVPLTALVAISPWLYDIRDLLQSDIASPFERSAENLIVMIQYHGVWVVPLAILAAWLGWQRRDPVVILAVGWLLLIMDFSSTGGIAALLPGINRFLHSLDIAWHGPIIPLTILGGMGLLWVWDSLIAPRTGRLNYRQAYAVNGLIAVGLLIAGLTSRTLLSADWLNLPDAYATEDDVIVLRYVSENTAPDARLLNFPVPEEGTWSPVLAERDSVYFPVLPYVQNAAESLQEQEAMLAFWQNPADPANAELLREVGIDYVVVPQIVANREAVDLMWRWDAPPAWEFEMQSDVSEAEYLELVFESKGAAVYQVIP